MLSKKINFNEVVLLLIPLLFFFLLFNIPVVRAQHFNDTWEFEFTTNTWTELSPEGPLPGAQRFFPHAYDSKRNRMIIAGGQGDDGYLFNETWALDLTRGSENWTLLSSENPDIIAFRGGVYDSKRDLFVVLAYSDEIFLLDLATNKWTVQPTSGTDPSPLVFTTHSVEYDAANDRYVVFGGRFGSDYTNRVRVLDAATFIWTDLTLASPDPIPESRALHGTVYDYNMERLLLFGGLISSGTSLNDTWQLTLASGSESWIRFAPPLVPLNRSQNAAAFDTKRGQMVIFGGLHYPDLIPLATLNDIWLFDGSYWTNPFPISSRPLPRRGPGAVYDQVNDRFALFGGEFISVFPFAFDAKIDLDPNTFNLKSGGKWITVYIALPTGIDPADIDLNTTGIYFIGQELIFPPLLADQTFGGKIGDGNKDMIPDLTIKIDRQTLIDLMQPAEETAITIAGALTTGDIFSGGDIIKTIEQGQEKSLASGLKSNPINYALYQNFPNPFNPETSIRFDLPRNEYVSVTIYNAISQEIRSLANRNYTAGSHSVLWDGRDSAGNPVPSGIYFYRIQAGSFSQIMKMVLLR